MATAEISSHQPSTKAGQLNVPGELGDWVVQAELLCRSS